ncbi:peptidase [Streptomyces sp. cmx-18-6]|uniref:peptidase n=1 Tax=Streptomyces sp. cmx-18-6 TaxID=2790930 RepID=UPI00397ED3E2
MSPTSCARLRDARALAALGLAAGIAVPAALLGGSQAAARPAPDVIPASLSAAGAADEQPACGDRDAKEFPVETRIHDAPKTYASGGGYGTWLLDLTNTTDAPCRALHPVLVLTDEDRRLTAEQIQVKFSEPGHPGTEHRVSWETTDRHEQIGVFGGGGTGASKGTGASGGTGPSGGTDASGDAGDSAGTGDSGDSGHFGDDFLGVTVPAGGTVSVRVQMAFTSDAVPGRVTAHAAVVQRRHQDKAKGGGREDGDWVGESGEYRFVIVDGATGEVPRPERTEPDIGSRTDVPAEPRPRTEASPSASSTPAPTTAPTTTPAPTGTGTAPTGTPTAPGSRAPEPVRTPEPVRPGNPDSSTPPRVDGGGKERPALPPHYGTGRPLPELARTGPELLPWAGAVAALLVLCGGALVAKGRRMRTTAG